MTDDRAPAGAAVAPPGLDERLRAAMREHAAGRFAAARVAYLAVLGDAPEAADAWHLLGVLEAQSGRHEEAARLIGCAIELCPHEAMFHNNLGNVCIERARLSEAEGHYARAIAIDPQRVDALNNLGVLLSRVGRAEDAERALCRAIELAPDFTDARQNLANHFLRGGRLADAVQVLTDALIVEPRDGGLRYLLGMAYVLLGRGDEAAAVYRGWLETDPDEPRARFHLAACTGAAVPERAPDAYLRRVFDGFSNSFDAKLAQLDYRAPALVEAALARIAGPPARASRVLDAGCGTGLCGALLAPHASHLSGVDLSAGMLAKARERAVYDELHQGELVAWLVQAAARGQRFDAICSADTLCYFGPLEAFADAARRALVPGGSLVFTVEAHDDAPGSADHSLQPCGRYSHRRGYLDAVLRDAGFGPPLLTEVVLRREADRPVRGWLASARANG